ATPRPTAPTPTTSRGRSGRTPDEPEQLGLNIRVLGHLDARSVLSAGAQDVVERQHGLVELCALVRVERLVLSGRPREVPGVHEDVGGIELVDRLVQRKLADVLVGQGAVRGRRVVEQLLYGVALDRPGG